MLIHSLTARKFSQAERATEDNAMVRDVLEEVLASHTGVPAQLAQEVRTIAITDVVYDEVTITVNLLLKLAVADVALMKHDRTLALFILKTLHQLLSLLAVLVVAAHVIEHRLEGVVLFRAYHASMFL